MNRRNFVAAAATIIVVVMLASAATAESDGLACNNRLIRGTYGFTIEGQKIGGPGPIGPQIGVALTTFDGHGYLTQIDSVSINGVKVADFTHTRATGTYTVNSDCTGNFNISFTDGRAPVSADFVVVEHGLEIDTVVTKPDNCGTTQTSVCLETRSIGKRRFARSR
jgi:hypothetical protein